MIISTYQKDAARTLIDKPDFKITDDEVMLIWNATGLVGETGELVDLLKKNIFHRHPLDRDKIKKELGDVLWYVAAICTKLDLNMGEVARENIEKLQKRYPNGYNSEDSIKRLDKSK